jgi:hypothetical protein
MMPKSRHRGKVDSRKSLTILAISSMLFSPGSTS